MPLRPKNGNDKPLLATAYPPRMRSDVRQIERRQMELKELHFLPFPLEAIKPRGWLAEQLRIQADGLSGHLDEFWPDIKDSAWIGGQAEGWERMPY